MGLLRHLLHDGRLPDAGRPHQQNRPLPLRGNGVLAGFVAGEICLNRIQNFLFCLPDIHIICPLPFRRFVRPAALPDLPLRPA